MDGDEDQDLTFDDLLGELQELLGAHVAVSCGAWSTSERGEVVTRVVDGEEETFIEYPEGGPGWVMHPIVEAGGRLRRGVASEQDPDAIVFVIGEESPGRFARIHLSPGWVRRAFWVEAEGTADGRALIIATVSAHTVWISRVDFTDDA